MTYVMTQTTEILGASAGAIYRLDEPLKVLTLQASVGLSAENANIPTGQGVIGESIARKQPAISKDIGCVPPQITLAVPLVIKEPVYGCLVLYFLGVREISADDIEIATVSADR